MQKFDLIAGMIVDMRSESPDMEKWLGELDVCNNAVTN